MKFRWRTLVKSQESVVADWQSIGEPMNKVESSLLLTTWCIDVHSSLRSTGSTSWTRSASSNRVLWAWLAGSRTFIAPFQIANFLWRLFAISTDTVESSSAYYEWTIRLPRVSLSCSTRVEWKGSLTGWGHTRDVRTSSTWTRLCSAQGKWNPRFGIARNQDQSYFQRRGSPSKLLLSLELSTGRGALSLSSSRRRASTQRPSAKI